MQDSYSTGEFYTFLKLGIWETGTVNFWGKAEILPAWYDFLLSQNLHGCYNESSPVRKHLDTGLYLLDLLYTGRDNLSGINTYRLVVAVCRSDMRHLEALYHIRIGNLLAVDTFFDVLNDENIILDNVLPGRRVHFTYRRKKRGSLSGNIPVGSRYIQHRSI